MPRKKSKSSRRKKATNGERASANPRGTPKQVGRPKGAKTKKHDDELIFPSRCKCGSTRRTAFRNSRTFRSNGVDPAGNPATHIVHHMTNCKDCNQLRRVREYICKPTSAREQSDAT